MKLYITEAWISLFSSFDLCFKTNIPDAEKCLSSCIKVSWISWLKMCSKALSNWTLVNMLLHIKSFPFLPMKVFCLLFLVFVLSLKKYCFSKLKFGVSFWYLEHYITTLIYFSHCISFVKIFAKILWLIVNI